MTYLIGGGAGFLLAMLLYKRARLMSWIKATGAFINTQWQKVTKKG